MERLITVVVARCPVNVDVPCAAVNVLKANRSPFFPQLLPLGRFVALPASFGISEGKLKAETAILAAINTWTQYHYKSLNPLASRNSLIVDKIGSTIIHLWRRHDCCNL